MAARFPIYSGTDITSLEAWSALAPPAGGDRHWVDGRSAKELARRFMGGVVPPEVARVLDSHTALAGFRPAYGTQRVYIGRIGPFGFALLLLVIGFLAAVMLLILIGTALLWIPLVAVLVIAAVISRLFRG